MKRLSPPYLVIASIHLAILDSGPSHSNLSPRSLLRYNIRNPPLASLMNPLTPPSFFRTHVSHSLPPTDDLHRNGVVFDFQFATPRLCVRHLGSGYSSVANNVLCFHSRTATTFEWHSIRPAAALPCSETVVTLRPA